MDYINEFMTDLKYVKNYSDNTVKAYVSDLKAFCEYLKNGDLSKVKPDDIRAYLKTLEAMSDKSIARNMTTLRMFYDYLMKRGIIKNNPTDGISGPKIGKYLPDVLSMDEVDRLLPEILSYFNS